MITWLRSGELGQTAQYRVASRSGGVSNSPYDELNVANWVGDSPEAVAANLNLLESSTATPIHLMKPEHGTEVLDVARADFRAKAADIMVTTERNTALLAPSADCVSVVVSATVKPFLMLAHVGWRGAAAGIAAKMISTAELYGVLSNQLAIVLGPAICGKCYPVSDLVHDEVVGQLPAASVKLANGFGLDLRAGLQDYFQNLGGEVSSDLPCTYESPDLFSYRRDQVTGRQAVVAWLN